MNEALLFCGENRKADLRRLKRAYDDVAAAAESLRTNRRAGQGCQRVILIEAERGLGKTRLAMELFRHLTTACDPDDYWPDAYGREHESVEVMPQADACDVTRRPPFLWWGMGIADGLNPGNTVFATLEDVLPHLMSARLAARRAQSGKEFFADAADLAVDLGIEFGTEISGLGLVKRFGQSALKIGKIVRRHYGETPEALSDGREQIDSVVEAVMADLTRLFNPSSPQFAGIPFVVFVDDAQFADRDPAMATFLERLLARGAREGWPLLVMLTHWSRQLGPWTDAAGHRYRASHVAQVLDHARTGCPTTPGAFAGEGGGSLSDGSFLQIDLSDPVENLDGALRNLFPGLAEGDVTAIVEKAGGNPRKLEQIIARMERKPRWFEATDPSGSLTEAGRDAVLALADLPIEDVVMERFEDTPAEVRHSMIVASLLGNRFVVDLVDRLGRARLHGETRTGLEDGERTYHFLRNIVDRSRNDIGAFTERLFYDVAQEYRKSGMARRDLPSWPQEAELIQALDDLLAEIVAAPERFESLNSDDLAEALSLAGTRMERAGVPEAGLALSRLIETENRRGNYEGGYAAASIFMSGYNSRKWSIQEIPFDLADIVAETLFKIGKTNDAGQLWFELEAVLNDCPPQEMTDQAWSELFIVRDRLATLRMLQSKVDAAASYYQRCLEAAAGLYSADPYNIEWTRNYFKSLTKLGEIHQTRGEYNDALSYYQKSLSMAENICSLRPADLVSQRDVFVALQKVGEVYAALGDEYAALDSFQLALAISRKLLKADPTEPSRLRDLSICQGSLGNIYVVRGELDAALDLYQASLTIRLRLASIDPADILFQEDLAAIYDEIGGIYLASGKKKLALDCFGTAISITERLTSLETHGTFWLSMLSTRREKIARIYRGYGNVTDAFEISRANIKTLERLAVVNFQDHQAKVNLLGGLTRLGDYSVARGENSDAHNYYNAAISISENMASSDPQNSMWQRNLATSHDRLGDFLMRSGESDAALRHYFSGLQIRERLVAADPEDERSSRSLLNSMVRLAEFGDNPIERLQRSISIAKRLEKQGYLGESGAGMIKDLYRRLNKITKD